MKLTELFKRPASLINVLLEIWEKSGYLQPGRTFPGSDDSYKRRDPETS